jgi:hypothetical protein
VCTISQHLRPEQKTKDGTFNLIPTESISDKDSNQSFDSDSDSATDHKPPEMELAYDASDKCPAANKAIGKNNTSVNKLATSHVSVRNIHCTNDIYNATEIVLTIQRSFLLAFRNPLNAQQTAKRFVLF